MYKTKPDHVCLLKKLLYGLRQAPRVWLSCLKDVLVNYRFHASKIDQSLFYHNKDGIKAFFMVYTDDILLTGFSVTFINGVITYLQSQFHLNVLCKLHYFLGMEATCDAHDAIFT